ncbi:MAG: hypothetical protein FJZ58_00430 [Chlamydiae bacterium]|nr:hypothetical protein [Chlamydiota bacterium]
MNKDMCWLCRIVYGTKRFFQVHKATRFWLFLLAYFIVFEVIPEVRGDKCFVLTRLVFGWSKELSSAPIQAYVLTEKQIGEIFVHPFEKPVLLSNKELFAQWKLGSPLYLMFHIKGRGRGTLGKIIYNLNHGIMKGQFEIHSLSLPSLPSQNITTSSPPGFHNMVIPIGENVSSFLENPDGYPEISFRWKELYLK